MSDVLPLNQLRDALDKLKAENEQLRNIQALLLAANKALCTAYIEHADAIKLLTSYQASVNHVLATSTEKVQTELENIDARVLGILRLAVAEGLTPQEEVTGPSVAEENAWFQQLRLSPSKSPMSGKKRTPTEDPDDPISSA